MLVYYLLVVFLSGGKIAVVGKIKYLKGESNFNIIAMPFTNIYNTLITAERRLLTIAFTLPVGKKIRITFDLHWFI